MKTENRVSIGAGILTSVFVMVAFGGGFFLGGKYGGLEEAKAYREKVETELYVEKEMKYIFSGLEKCHTYVEDKKKKEAEDAAKARSK